jgi:hypothetical protein
VVRRQHSEFESTSQHESTHASVLAEDLMLCSHCSLWFSPKHFTRFTYAKAGGKRSRQLFKKCNTLKILHVDSLDQVARQVREDEPKMFVHYVIIATYEGTEAMGIVKNELSRLDAQYVTKESVQIVNWKIQGTRDAVRTPNSDIINLMTVSGAMVNQVTGDSQEVINHSTMKFYNHLKVVVRNPEALF